MEIETRITAAGSNNNFYENSTTTPIADEETDEQFIDYRELVPGVELCFD